MSRDLYNDGGMLVTKEGEPVDYVRGPWDVRRYMFPAYVPEGFVLCPECKGRGLADRSFWDWLFGWYPNCEVCGGISVIKRAPPPGPPPPKKTCRRCGDCQ